MKSIFCIFILSLVSAITLNAQFAISGKIKDTEHAPIAGATIKIESSGMGDISDKNGEFEIRKVKSGSYKLLISFIGYKTESYSVEVGKSDVNNIEITLKEQAINIGEVIVSVNRHATAPQEVALSVSQIRSERLANLGANRIDEALRYVPGVTMNNDQISIRGSSGVAFGVGSRVAFSVDGISMLSADNGDIKFDMLPINAIDKIEIIKGAGSALYGTGALAGVINTITKDPTKDEDLRLNIASGVYTKPRYEQWHYSDNLHFNTNVNGYYSQSFGDFGLMVSSTIINDEGYKNYGDSHRKNLFSKVNYNFTEYTKASIILSYSGDNHSDWVYWNSLDSATFPPSTTNKNIRMISDKYTIAGEFRHIFNSKSYMLFRSGFYNTLIENTEIKNSTQYRESNGRTFNNELQYNTSILPIFYLTIGAVHQLNSVDAYSFGKRNQQIYSGYFQGELTPLKELIIQTGLRTDLEKTESIEGKFQLSPKFALTYKPTDDLNIRSSFGMGFRSPAIAERFASIEYNGFNVIENLALKPEVSRTYEIGFNYNFNLPNFPIYIDFSVFHSEYKDFIEPTYIINSNSPYIQFRNISRARIDGLDFSVKTLLFNKIGLDLSAMIIDPMDKDSNTTLKYRSKFSFIAGAFIPLGIFEFFIDYRYSKKVVNIDEILVKSGFIKDVDARVDIHVVDARLVFDLHKALDLPIKLTLNCKNIFDYYYTEILGNLAPTRFIGLQAEFRY